MIAGIGTDMVDIRRIAAARLRHGPRFDRRLFTEQEIAYCLAQPSPASAFAKRFAAKEAAVKALGHGVRNGVNLRQIEVVRSELGAPSLHFHDKAGQLLAGRKAHLSLSDEYPYAFAFVVIEQA